LGINIIIFSRILISEDFGLIQGFAEFDTRQLLKREQNISRDNIDMAWTVKIMPGVEQEAIA